MKRTYVRPTMVGERFVANEYVAACHDQNTVYKFKCDAPGGRLYYYPGSDGKVDGVHDKSDRAKFLGDYHPCSKKHEASTTNVFYDGFVDYNWNGKQDSGEGVIVWRGPRNNNGKVCMIAISSSLSFRLFPVSWFIQSNTIWA